VSFRQTIYTFFVLLGVSAGYFLVRTLTAPGDGESFTVYGGGYSRDDVVGVDVFTERSFQSVIFSGGRYWILHKKKKEYCIPARKKQMYTFFNGLDAVRLLRKVSRGDKPLEEWRLGKKASRLVLTYGDGTKREIFIGADNPAGRGVFIRTGADTDTVYLVSAHVRIASEAVLFQLVEDRILLADPEDVVSFSILGKRTEEWKPNRVTCERTGHDGWLITDPVRKKADVKAVEKFLSLLTSLRFESLDEALYRAEPGDDAVLSFTARLKDGKRERLFFYPGKADVMTRKRYAMVNTRTGLAGYVYPPVFNAVNKSFISFIWRRLFQGDPRRIKIIRVKKGTRTVTFVHRETGDWIVSEYFDSPADPRLMARILDAIMNFRVTRFVSDAVRDYGKYGLMPPVAMLTIEEFEAEDARSYGYYFGKQVEGSEEEVYFKEVDANEVYAVPYTFLRLLSRPARAYAMRRVFDMKKELIDRVKIVRRDRAYKFYRSDIEGWYAKAPLLTKRIDGERLDKLLTLLSGLEFEDIPVPETVPVEAFDDARTLMTVEVHARAPTHPDLRKSLWPEDEKEALLLVSTLKDPRGNVYVKRKFTNLVCTVKPSVVEFLGGEFLDTSVFIEDVSAAVGITVSYRDGRKVVMEKKGDRWRIADPGGARVDERAVVAYLRMLDALKADGVFRYKTTEEERKRLGFDAPLLAVEVSRGVGETEGFSLAPHPARPRWGLVRRKGEVYILAVSALKRTRLEVPPSYFMLGGPRR